MNNLSAEIIKNDSLPIQVQEDFLTNVLTPYKDHTQYLRLAQILEVSSNKEDDYLVLARGKFCIPTSCYIDDTGHFNAVEFNICYNQLAYVMFAYILKSNLFEAFFFRKKGSNIDFSTFKKNQLSSMLIAKIESKFISLINAKDFSADLKLISIKSRKNAIFVSTEVKFYDKWGGRSEGKVFLTYNPEFNM